MEIRRLETSERQSAIGLLDGWERPDGPRARDSLRREIEADPNLAERNVWVAADRGEVLGCVQIFPRRLRVLGHGIPSGGLGNLFVRRDHRGSGMASRLVECAATAMRERGMELAVAFTSRRGLLQRLGWRTWTSHRSILRRAEQRNPERTEAAARPAIEFVPLDRHRERALAALKAIHSAYSGSRNGTVVRDDQLWETSIELADRSTEEFLVARREGLAVAYARAVLLDEGLTVTELGRFEDGSQALARLLAQMLEARPDDPFACAGRGSKELRSFVVLPTFDDIGLTVGLEHEGVTSHPFDDDSGMIRCLDVSALAARLDVELLPAEDEASFLKRILPPEGFVFWPADRF